MPARIKTSQRFTPRPGTNHWEKFITLSGSQVDQKGLFLFIIKIIIAGNRPVVNVKKISNYAILPNMSQYIAADVGGTQLRAALYPSEGLTPITLKRLPTHSSQAGASPFDRLCELIASIWPENGQVSVISVTAPGPINPQAGKVLNTPNIPGWIDFPLGEMLHGCFHVPVVMGNDANMAALCEWKYGAGQGHHHLVYLTISTGIGSGIICDDRLVSGSNGLAGELGHITVLPDGPLCGCGHRGHLEALASGTAIAHWIEEEIAQGVQTSLKAGVPVTARLAADAAHQGDELCLAAFARAGYYLGSALADFLHIFNPSIIILGGGVSRSGALLMEPMQQAMRETVFAPGYLENLSIATAAFGDEAGLVGALALARTMYPPDFSDYAAP
jgi:glucokinase